MKRIWIYLINTFLVNTQKSPTKMLGIANDHDSRLNGAIGDPDILAIYTVFHALLLVFQNLYSAWKAAVSLRMSRTLSLTNQFRLLSETWIKAWEGKVHSVFPEGSPEALAIFPKKRAPFQKGTYDERINAVNTLSTSMSSHPSLATVKADVDAKYAILVAARDVQKQAMQNVSSASIEVEKQRTTMGQYLYKDLGLLMAKFFMDPTEVVQFYNLSLLRRSSSEADGQFNLGGTVNPGSSLVVSVPKKFELSINVSFLIANSEGGSELHFFFADSASTADSAQKATILPGESLEATAGEMGWSTERNILIVKNAGSLTAEYEMTVTEAVA